jgi:hypothetical protein
VLGGFRRRGPWAAAPASADNSEYINYPQKNDTYLASKYNAQQLLNDGYNVCDAGRRLVAVIHGRESRRHCDRGVAEGDLTARRLRLRGDRGWRDDGTASDSCAFAPHQSCSVLTVSPWARRRSDATA